MPNCHGIHSHCHPVTVILVIALLSIIVSLIHLSTSILFQYIGIRLQSYSHTVIQAYSHTDIQSYRPSCSSKSVRTSRKGLRGSSKGVRQSLRDFDPTLRDFGLLHIFFQILGRAPKIHTPQKSYGSSPFESVRRQ